MLFRDLGYRTILAALALPIFGLMVGPVRQADAQGTRMLRDPDGGPNQNVFVHANGANRRWSRPVKRNTGRKLTTVVLTAVITAGTTSAAA